ncbi:MAG: rhamnogalacturonan lyase [Pontiellaceae bacterium]|nr:rhamnogalacturonan lyase [Pontiellaceae bacterium]MBN2784167.1 rhamnogalacturonan lyase [Pontiellaceae bacterium]
MQKRFFVPLCFLISLSLQSAFAQDVAVPAAVESQPLRKMEYMDRGLFAMNLGGRVYVGWRLLATDPDDIVFDVYRKPPGTKPTKLNDEPVMQTTDLMDEHPGLLVKGTRYFVVPIINGEQGDPVVTEVNYKKAPPYFSIELQPPGSGYSANDCSAADLDGDGRYEIILKWDPDNSKDNSQWGITGNVFIDAYTQDGKRLWRIDLGPNIRAGAHYTQFMVYDFDCNGKAEMICKTADGTKDGRGKVIGDEKKVWRTDGGHILAGPEYLTCFDGETGAAVCTTDYLPYRVPGSTDIEPDESALKATWGDRHGYDGNRGERYLACVAYLDGVHPSVVMCRGYYTRSFLVAWDLVDGQLVNRWIFDSDEQKQGEYGGQGNHNLVAADVDGDGKDEITYGAMCVDDNGKGLYTTAMGHGDAMHLTDLDPSRPGMELWTCQEHAPYGNALRDAATGEIIFRREAGKDTGRACAGDIDPTHPGAELWGSTGCPLYDVQGNTITNKYDLPMNFVINWDDDDLVELLSGTQISKYNWKTNTRDVLLDVSEYDCKSNNGSKGTPCLSADLFGDYREEVIWRTSDSKELRIFTTTIPARRRLITLMQDPQYRLSIVWQNVSYNQPPHTSFFMGDGMKVPPKPAIEIIYPNRNVR